MPSDVAPVSARSPPPPANAVANSFTSATGVLTTKGHRRNKSYWELEETLHTELHNFVYENGMPKGHESTHHPIRDPRLDEWIRSQGGGWGPQWYVELKNLGQHKLQRIERSLHINPQSQNDWRDIYNEAFPNRRKLSPVSNVSPEPRYTPKERAVIAEQKALRAASIAVRNCQGSCHKKRIEAGVVALKSVMSDGTLPNDALLIADTAVRQVEPTPFTIDDLMPLLSCGLCYQAMRDPQRICAVNEITNSLCFHSFCKSCLWRHFWKHQHKWCPICWTYVTNTQSQVVPDREKKTLAELQQDQI